MLCNKNCMLWKNFHTLPNSDPPILQPRKKGLRAHPYDWGSSNWWALTLRAWACPHFGAHKQAGVFTCLYRLPQGSGSHMTWAPTWHGLPHNLRTRLGLPSYWDLLRALSGLTQGSLWDHSGITQGSLGDNRGLTWGSQWALMARLIYRRHSLNLFLSCSKKNEQRYQFFIFDI